MRRAQIVCGIVTLYAVLGLLPGIMWQAHGSRYAELFAVAVLGLISLGSIMAIRIGIKRKYDQTIALIPVTGLAVLGALIGFWGVSPLLFPLCLLLLVTTIVSGISMTREWLSEPIEAHH